MKGTRPLIWGSNKLPLTSLCSIFSLVQCPVWEIDVLTHRS